MNEEEKEEYEMAAKAVGYEIGYDKIFGEFYVETTARGGNKIKRPWDPLSNDDDAFRLMVDQKMGFIAFNGSESYKGMRRRIFHSAVCKGRALEDSRSQDFYEYMPGGL